MKTIVKGTLLVALGFFGLTVGMTAVTANAKTKVKAIPLSTEYVRTKQDMYVGISQKAGKHSQRLLKKKGSLLQLVSSDTVKVGGKYVEMGVFTSGAVHYDRLKNLKYTLKGTVPLTTKYFTPVKLKAPLRTQMLYQGKGFTVAKDPAGIEQVNHPAGFYLTLDNYLQAYSATAMKQNALTESIVDWDKVWQPTHAVKLTKVTVKGNTTTAYYRTPVKGLPNKKIKKGQYKLVIKNLKTKGVQDANQIDDTYDTSASWTNYTVNGKPYFVGNVAYGLD